MRSHSHRCEQGITTTLFRLTQSPVIEAIKAGNLTAIIFFLKTRGKSRGYSERSEFGHTTDDEPIKFTFKINGRASEAAE